MLYVNIYTIFSMTPKLLFGYIASNVGIIAFNWNIFGGGEYRWRNNVGISPSTSEVWQSLYYDLHKWASLEYGSSIDCT